MLGDRLRQLAATNPAAITDILRPQPVFANGQQRGYRIYPGRNRSQFNRLGLLPGDLVTAINGTPLDDASRGMDILQTMNTASAVTMTVERNGETVQVNVNNAQIAADAAAAAALPEAIPVNEVPDQVRWFRGVTMKHKLFQRSTRLAAIGLALLLAVGTLPTPAGAQAQGSITPNYKDADLSQIIEAVSAVTGKNFIVDPRVKAQVTMLSSTPMTPNAFYEAFLSILQVHGFVAVPSGDTIKIIPDANARQVPANDLPGRVSATSDEIVTQVVAVKNVSAAQLVPILRPLIPQYGHLAAYPASNMLIISDRASNVNRIVRIIQRIDQQGDEAVDVVQLQHAARRKSCASSTACTRVPGPAGEGAGMPQVKIIADERTNSVLISGETSQRLRLKTLVAHLDTPLQSGGDTQVRYLKYADAEKLSQKLREQIQGIAAAAMPAGAAGAGAAAPTLMSSGGDKSVTIWAEPQTNALVVTAPPKVMRSVMAIVDRLDIRRAQVLVEAILVEMSADKAMDLGVNWLIADTDSERQLAAGGRLRPARGRHRHRPDHPGRAESRQRIAGLPSGLTMGLGQIVNSGTSWAAVIRAVGGMGNTNIIATPSIVTLDNEEAEIKIAQEVPFVTGQYTSQGVERNRRRRQPVPDHPARGSRQHPQDHAADQRRQLRAARRSRRRPRASRRVRSRSPTT